MPVAVRFLRRLPILAGLLALLPATVPQPTDSKATFAALRAVDQRMATIAYRLTTANAPLCRGLVPVPGWAIHSLGQYDRSLRDAARGSFGFDAPIAVEAVVAGGPAARAGVVADDSIAAINGVVLGGVPGAKADSSARDAANAVIARQPVGAPLRVDLVKRGARRTVAVDAVAGCPGSFEVLLGPGMEASADGQTVQIAVRFFERYTDDQIAVVVAHELAHNMLRHRARLDAAKVSRGLFAEVGRNGRLFRRTETEADLLGMHVIRNAGYDPLSAVAFWRDHGGDVDGGLFRSRTHPSSKARAQAIADEIARIPAGSARPYLPPILASRDTPLQ